MSLANNLIKFGKYKGQPFEVLAADPDWVQWAIDNNVLQQRQPDLFQFVINNFQAPSETPEHNRLQSLFLDVSFVVGFTSAALNLPDPDQLAVTITELQFEELGWDVVIEATTEPFCFIEKSRNGVLNVDNDNSGWGDKMENFPSLRIMYKAFHGEPVTLYVELKPSMGDDYPAILRQMKNCKTLPYGKQKKVLLIEQYTGNGVSFDDVKKVFANEKIKILLCEKE